MLVLFAKKPGPRLNRSLREVFRETPRKDEEWRKCQQQCKLEEKTV